MVLHLIPDIDVLYLAIHRVAREHERVFLISKFVLPRRLQYVKLIVCFRWPGSRWRVRHGSLGEW